MAKPLYGDLNLLGQSWRCYQCQNMEAVWQPHGRTDPKEAYCFSCWEKKGGVMPEPHFPKISGDCEMIVGDDPYEFPFLMGSDGKPVRGTGPLGPITHHLPPADNDSIKDDEEEGETLV